MARGKKGGGCLEIVLAIFGLFFCGVLGIGAMFADCARTHSSNAASMSAPIATVDTTTPLGPSPPAQRTYAVKAGDGWWAIASANGVAMNDLLAANNATAETPLQPAQIVVLPGGGGPARVAPQPLTQQVYVAPQAAYVPAPDYVPGPAYGYGDPEKTVHVREYTRRDGTVVHEHYRRPPHSR